MNKELTIQCSANPPGYVDKHGIKHTWSMYEGWVEHRVDGVIHSTQALQGFLDYGIPSLLRRWSEYSAEIKAIEK